MPNKETRSQLYTLLDGKLILDQKKSLILRTSLLLHFSWFTDKSKVLPCFVLQICWWADLALNALSVGSQNKICLGLMSTRVG